MSALKRIGTHRIVIDLPHEEWLALSHFKGGRDSDKCCRIIEVACARVMSMVSEAEQKNHDLQTKTLQRPWWRKFTNQ